MKPGELTTALRIAWLVLSTVILGILVTPWMVTEAQIATVIPACESKVRYQKECSFCGMTTAFFSIRRGDFEEAQRSNRGSVPLYSAFVLDEAVMLGFLAYRARPGKYVCNEAKNMIT